MIRFADTGEAITLGAALREGEIAANIAKRVNRVVEIVPDTATWGDWARGWACVYDTYAKGIKEHVDK